MSPNTIAANIRNSIDFEDADLRGYNFCGKDLRGMAFKNCQMDDCLMDATTSLRFAQFSGTTKTAKIIGFDEAYKATM